MGVISIDDRHQRGVDLVKCGKALIEEEDQLTMECLIEGVEEDRAPCNLRDTLDTCLLIPLANAALPEDTQTHKDHFFRQVLPIFAHRLDDADSPLPVLFRHQKPLNTEYGSLTMSLCETSFNLDEAREVFTRNPERYLLWLFEYAVFKRAQLMHEKLWHLCPEFYLLGLAYEALAWKLNDAKVPEWLFHRLNDIGMLHTRHDNEFPDPSINWNTWSLPANKQNKHNNAYQKFRGEYEKMLE